MARYHSRRIYACRWYLLLQVIGKTNSYLMMPEEPWEQHGNCDNTIFPCGAIADYDKDQIRLYYGACDYAICLATGSLSETVDACLKGL